MVTQFMHGGRGGEEQCSFRTRTGASKPVGGRTGWVRTVFLSHTCRNQTSFSVRNKKYGFGTNLKYNFAKELVDNYRTVHGDTVYAWWTGWTRTVFFSHTYRSQ